VAHGEPAVGKDVAKAVLSPARGDIGSKSQQARDGAHAMFLPDGRRMPPLPGLMRLG